MSLIRSVRFLRSEPMGDRSARFVYEVPVSDGPALTMILEVDPAHPLTYAAEFRPSDAWEGVDAEDRERMAGEALTETLRRMHDARPRRPN